MEEPGDAVADDLERIRFRIVEICRERVVGDQSLLLSALGKLLGDDLRVLKAKSGSLTEFLHDNLPAEYRVAQVGPHRNIFSIVRADNEPRAVKKISEELGSSSHQGRRFNSKFWAAFAVPFPEGYSHRFLNVREIYFRDTNGDKSEHEYEVDRSFVPPVDDPTRDASIKVNIDQWLARNKLDAKDFLVGERRSDARERQPSNQVSVLDLVIGALDHRQLQAISLPLDVVAVMMRKKVGEDLG